MFASKNSVRKHKRKFHKIKIFASEVGIMVDKYGYLVSKSSKCFIRSLHLMQRTMTSLMFCLAPPRLLHQNIG
jgi:hypothetical protein